MLGKFILSWSTSRVERLIAMAIACPLSLCASSRPYYSRRVIEFSVAHLRFLGGRPEDKNSRIAMALSERVNNELKCKH